MQFFSFKKAVFLAIFAALASGVQATPIVFDFKSANPLDSGGAMTVNGVTLTVAAGTLQTSQGTTTQLGGASVTENANYGLGVSTGDDGLDGIQNGQTRKEDYLVFTFGSAVSLDKIGFSQVSSTDLVSVSYLSAGNWVSLASFFLPSGITYDLHDLSPDLVSTSFRISALRSDTNDSHFRVGELTLAAAEADTRDLPEPGSLVLMATALMGLAVVRRKR